jgi:hypothetical protein
MQEATYEKCVKPDGAFNGKKVGGGAACLQGQRPVL